jgi:SAM-dependent methyltransferase
MSSFYGWSGPSELLPRSIFLKPLVTGRRVLELGTVALTGGATAVALLRLGARTVTAFDEDAAAVERAREEHRGSGVSFRTGRADELPERSFDLVLVEDAARVIAPGAAAALGRLLAPTGHLVVPIRNPAGPALAGMAMAGEPGGPGWAEVTGALRPVFPSIEVATQQALVGYVLAPVTGREAKLDIDASAGGTAAAYWLLLCGQEPAGLSDQALVALPPEPLLGLRAEPEGEAPGEELRAEVARLEARIEELQAAPAERDRRAESAAEIARLEARVAELEAQVAAEQERAGHLAEEVARAEARAAEIGAAAEAERRRREELQREAERAREGLREKETWVDGLRCEVEDREEAETRAQAELRVARARLARLEPELEAANGMLKRVREQLAARIHELAAARQAISERNEDLRLAEAELERAREYARTEREARLAAEQAGGAERLAALEAELARAERERDEARARAAAAGERKTALSRDEAAAGEGREIEADAVRQARDELRERVAALALEGAAAAAARDQLWEKFTESERTAAALRERVAAVALEGAAAAAARDQLWEKVTESERTAAMLRERVAALEAERDRAVAEADRLRSRCEEVERALAAAAAAGPANQVPPNEVGGAPEGSGREAG